MPIGAKYHGEPLLSLETLSPTFESMIVIMCLKAIHPDLPDFIMQNKGMLFMEKHLTSVIYRVNSVTPWTPYWLRWRLKTASTG